jgi:hypothetical protein
MEKQDRTDFEERKECALNLFALLIPQLNCKFHIIGEFFDDLV